MNRWVSILLLFPVVTCVVCADAWGQRPSPAGQLKRMGALEFLIGEWEGEGWISFGPEKREEFFQREEVKSKLGGLLLIVEGLATAKGSDADSVVHQALAVISYDSKEERYRFAAYTADGRSVDAAATVGDREMQWGFEGPWGAIRYTIRVTDDGGWFEVGENSQDGTNWRKFLEMRLKRVRSDVR